VSGIHPTAHRSIDVRTPHLPPELLAGAQQRYTEHYPRISHGVHWRLRRARRRPDHDELIQEGLCIAWDIVTHDELRGVPWTRYPFTIGAFAGRAALNGRRFTSASPNCYPESAEAVAARSRGQGRRYYLAALRRTPPPRCMSPQIPASPAVLAQWHLDVEAWLATFGQPWLDMIAALAEGVPTRQAVRLAGLPQSARPWIRPYLRATWCAMTH
jgi:hypothetical protein